MLLWTWGYKYLFRFLLLLLLDMYSEAGLLDHMVILALSFWGAAILFSIWLHHFTFLPAADKGSRFSTALSTIVLFFSFFFSFLFFFFLSSFLSSYCSYPNGCEEMIILFFCLFPSLLLTNEHSLVYLWEKYVFICSHCHLEYMFFFCMFRVFPLWYQHSFQGKWF